MRFYFRLQIKIVLRFLREIGLPLPLTLTVLIFLFIQASIVINSFSYGEWVYVFLSIAYLVSFTSFDRIRFLEKNLSKTLLLQIRLSENLLFMLPFSIYLLIRSNFVQALILVCLAGFLAFFKIRPVVGLPVIPHPFAKYDYEWISAYRKYFLLPIPFLIGYTMGIIVGNSMLSLVCAVILMLQLTSAFHGKPENPIFLWQYKRSTRSFLWFKIFRIMVYSMPFMLLFILLLATDFNKLSFILLIFLYCLLVVVGSFLSKYSYYPSPVSQLGQSIFVGIVLSGFLLPYIALAAPFIIYMQSVKSIRSIKPILDDPH